MCELDVFVGNYAIIDWEVYSLWLSGRSIAEAGPFKIFLCEVVMKPTYRVSQIEIYSADMRSDQRLWRSFDIDEMKTVKTKCHNLLNMQVEI